MKAIRLHQYGRYDSLHIEEVPVSQIADDEVLVRIKAAAVNHIDYLKASGALKQFYPLTFPWIPGRDFAGIVERVGEKTTGFKPGDAVFGDCETGGVYAAYAAVKAENIAHKPENLSYPEAASVPVAALTAWQGLFIHAQLKPGQTILVHGGAGAVGAYLVQLSHWAGAKIIATASKSDQPYVQSLGASQVIDYQSVRFENIAGKVDVVFDLVGGEVQQRSYTVLKEGGYLIATNQPPVAAETQKYKVTALMMHQKPSATDLTQISALLEKGVIKPAVSKIFPLEKAAQAWQELSGKSMKRKDYPAGSLVKKQGKLVLEVSQGRGYL